MFLRPGRRLVHDRPLLTTVLTVALAVALALGSLAGVLYAVEHQMGRSTSPSLGPASTAGCETDPAKPKRQFRAMWITSVSNIDWPSKTGLDEATIKAEYLALLDVAVANRFNAVMVMTRIAGDTLWPSRYEPWSPLITGVRGKDPGWDPMAFAVDEAHKRGLAFHAWYNPYRASTGAPDGAGGDINQLADGHPLRKRPDWAIVYPPNGTTGARIYYNPGEPEARKFIEDAMLDAVARYDVDGVHFDDFFYPYPVKDQEFPDEPTYSKYRGSNQDKAAWRRANVDMMIKEMHHRIHQLKPWVQFGVSPFGIWRNASSDPAGSDTAGNSSYTANSADTKRWVEQGWIDYIVPQLYWTIGFDKADYAKLVPWWANVVKKTDVKLYIGQASYRAGTSQTGWSNQAELSSHLTLNRKYPEVEGDIYFSAKDVRADRGGTMSRLRAEQYAAPALLPQDAGSSAASRAAPMVTEVREEQKTEQGAVPVRVSWSPPPNWRAGSNRVSSYAVYRFDGTAIPDRCGFADATHLVGTVSEPSFIDTTTTGGQSYSYVVSALDRRGRESDLSRPGTITRSP